MKEKKEDYERLFKTFDERQKEAEKTMLAAKTAEEKKRLQVY